MMDSNEWLLVIAGIAVVVGVFMEGWEHWEDIKTKGWRPLTPKFGFAILVLGLFVETYAEIRIGQADTQFRVDAMDRIGDLNKENADLRSFRVLNSEQQRRIRNKLRPFAGTRFDLGVDVDPEAIQLMYVVAEILQSSGWELKPAKASVTLPPFQAGIAVGGKGVSIESPRNFEHASTALCDALAAEGIVPLQISGDRSDPTTDRIHVIISRKP